MSGTYKIFEELLQEKGLTPYKVSKATGIANSTLSDWKRGITEPKYDKLCVLAEFLGVSVGRFGAVSQENEPVPFPDSDFERKMKLLARKGDKISDSDKEKLLKIFESTLDTFLDASEEDDDNR